MIPAGKKIEIYSLIYKPDFIKLQYESLRNILDEDYEYIIINNARNPRLRQLYESLKRRETSIIQLFKAVTTVKLNKNRIHRLARELGVREIQVKPNREYNQRSRFVSRYVAESLNWTFRSLITGGMERDSIVLLLDSDMFFFSPVSINSLLEGSAIGIIPQLRGTTVRYLWTGFAIFDLSLLPKGSHLDFNLGIIDQQRCDVGGMTHYFLNNYKPTEKLFEFINLITLREDRDIYYIEANINGNVNVNFKLDKNFNIIDFDIIEKGDHVSLVIRSSEMEVRSQYEKALGQVVRLCKGLNVNPKNLDFIRCKNSDVEDFFIVHYKNGSNQRDFETKTYFKEKISWIAELVKKENIDHILKGT